MLELAELITFVSTYQKLKRYFGNLDSFSIYDIIKLAFLRKENLALNHILYWQCIFVD